MKIYIETVMGTKTESLDGKSININGVDVKISTGAVIQAKSGLPFIAHGMTVAGEINQDTVLVHDVRTGNVSDVPISDVHELTNLPPDRSLSESVQNAFAPRSDNAPSQHQTNGVDDEDLQQKHSGFKMK
jgi:hypothetical protein